MRLQQQLRELAESRPSIFAPHWIDEAKRVMTQAAHALDAADEAIAEPRPTRLIRPSCGGNAHTKGD